MNIESILTDGEDRRRRQKKLLTASCRRLHDQIAVDIRLYLKKETDAINKLIKGLLDTLCELAEKHTDTVMPGYTHLQRARPVTLAYHLLAYYQMFFTRQGKDLQTVLKGSTDCLLEAALWQALPMIPTRFPGRKTAFEVLQTGWMLSRTEFDSFSTGSSIMPQKKKILIWPSLSLLAKPAEYMESHESAYNMQGTPSCFQ